MKLTAGHIRTIIDHRPETLRGERPEVGLGDLRRDGKKWRELGDLHDVRAPVARLFARVQRRMLGSGRPGSPKAQSLSTGILR
jgi:hypothetical protein